MHIPYENGGGTGESKEAMFNRIARALRIAGECHGKAIDDMIVGLIKNERPEDPIDEVIEITEEAWENNDLYISGDRRDNGPT